MSIEALLKALPVSGIETQTIAWITGLVPKRSTDVVEPSIEFLEPPAGIWVPYVNPVEAIAILLRHEGMSAEEAVRKAEQAYSDLRSELVLLERPPLYNCCDEIRRVPECVPVPRLLAYLRRERLAPEALCAFLEGACEVTGRVRIFTGPDNWNRPLRLSELPEVPPAKAMIEFFVGLPSDLVWAHSPDGNQFPIELLEQWRADMRPMVAKLESALGRKLYHFADPEIDYDDDNCHRFLALHCWCSLVPDSNFVSYLLEVTGIESVGALKAALVSPASYRHAFEMNDAFVGIEPWPACRFEYLGDKRKRVGVVFQSREARLRAEEVALQQIGADVLFLAPRELTTQDWTEQATQFGRSWEIWHDFTKPVSFLAQLDELHVVSDQDLPGQGWQLCVSKEVETLMWRAYKDGVPLRFHSPNDVGSSNPEVSMEKHGTAAAVVRVDSERKTYTDHLGIVRVSPDYGSSGLWNDRGQNLSYDSLDLPLSIVRRVAAWQRDYDDTLIPILPETADDAWWERHSQEEMGIVFELQRVLGDRVTVQFWEGESWKPAIPCRPRRIAPQPTTGHESREPARPGVVDLCAMRLRPLSDADETWAGDTSNPAQARLAVRYARMFNTFDDTWMSECLTEQSRYASQNVLETLEGKTIAGYWRSKLATLRAQGARARVAADIGALADGRPCAILYQARGADDGNCLSMPAALVLFEADHNSLLHRADMVTVAPSPLSARPARLFPGLRRNSRPSWKWS